WLIGRGLSLEARSTCWRKAIQAHSFAGRNAPRRSSAELFDASRIHHAPEPDMGGGGVLGLRRACRRTVAVAVFRRAQVRPSLERLADRRVGRAGRRAT